MNCGHCGHKNQANSKFCNECGTPLAAVCPSCAAEQPAGSKFCNQCGSVMAIQPVPAQAAPPTTTAVRKQVTALFADLVGSTAFGEQLDPEAARTALGPYFEILRSSIESHAGTVVKFTGDGVLAIFGIPEVAEDDALRAVAAGNELQSRFGAFAAQVRDQHGVELGLRVGMNTGELVISDGDEDLVGDVLNTAARLEAACQPGRVLVGEDTWRLTRSAVSYEVLGEVRVKGKADALATFQVAETDHGAREDATPFVGRQSEFSTLTEAFEAACAAPAARLVTVIGAPGVGKTRLAAELRAAVNARSFDLRFERRGSTTFTPIVELLRELTTTASADDVARLVGDHAESERLAAVLSSLAGHGESRSTEESFWAVRRLLEHLAADEPIVVVVDDIQWAEPLFWDLLDHLVEWTSAPIMLLALARPELRELRPELAQTGGRVAASVSLEGLDAATTRELAERLLDTDELPTDLVDRLPSSTEGNPLFVRELVQMLVDDGVLERVDDRWRLTIDVDAIEVPPTIISLLASRVERLPDDERQVVELASVIGTEFDRGLLGAIAGDDLANRLGALIDRLRRKDLVEPSGAWTGDHPVYRFHHVLVRDAAYRRLLKGNRADLHERVGHYLEDHGETGDELDVMLAHHYEQVVQYRGELGTVDDATRALAATAIQRLYGASHQALSREELTASGSYARRALALQPDGAMRSDLLTLGCEALLSSGNVAGGAELVAQLAEVAGDERLAAWLDCFRAQLWSLTDSERLTEAAELADGAGGRLDALDDQSGVAKARLVRALALARLGQVGACEAELDLALAAARAAGDRRRTVAVLGAAPVAALWGPSPVARAGGRCLDVLRLLRITTSSPAVEAMSIRCQGMLEALRGRFDSAREKLEASRATARELGLRQGLYETELFAGFVELWADDPKAAEPHLRLASEGLGALGIGADAGQANALLARALLQQGRVDEADALANAALDAAGQNLQTAIASRAVLAEVRAHQSRHAEAKALADEAVKIAEPTDITLDHALALEAAARVAVRGGNQTHTEARRRADELFYAKGVVAPEPTGRGDVPISQDAGDVTPPAALAPTCLELVPNTAYRVAAEFVGALKSGDEAAMASLFHPEYTAEIRRPQAGLDVSSDDVLVVLAGMVEQGVDLTDRLVATRGDDLCLIRYQLEADLGSDQRYTLFQTRDGLGVRAVWFESDHFLDAMHELEVAWVDLGGPADIAQIWRRSYEAQAAGDPALVRDEFAADFIDIDHRAVGKGERTRDDYLATFGAMIELGATFYVSEFLAYDHDLHMMRTAVLNEHGDDADGAILVAVKQDGKLSRSDTFASRDVAGARQRYDELMTERRQQPDLGGACPRMNTAWHATERFRAALFAGDRDAMRATLADECSFDVRISLFDAADDMSYDQLIDLMFQLVEQTDDMTGTLLAVRGDDLALNHFRFESTTGTLHRFVLIRTNDGLVTNAVYFDETQFFEALIELDRQWVELGGSALVAQFWDLLYEMQHSSDPSSLQSALSENFADNDRRPLGKGTRSRDDYVSTFAAFVEAGISVYVADVASLEHDIALTRLNSINEHREVADHAIAVARFDDGLLSAVDSFAPEDTRLARQRFDELVAERTPPSMGLPGNEAWVTLLRFDALWNDGDIQGMREMLHPEYAHELRAASLRAADGLGRDEFLQMAAETFEQGAQVSSTLIATRGDELALVRVDMDAPLGTGQRYSVVRVDSGQALATFVFRDTEFFDALIELDRQWVELGGGPEYAETAEVWRLMYESQQAGDPALIGRTFVDDFVAVDHRQIGKGLRTREEYIATTAAFFEHGNRVYVSCLPAAEAGKNLLRTTITDSRGEISDDCWGIGVIAGAKLARIETFALQDFDTAQRRFDELVTARLGESARPQTVRAPLDNQATRVANGLADAMAANDPEAALSLLHPGVESFNHEAFGVSDGFFDRTVLVESGFMLFEGATAQSASVEPVAIRGDSVALVRTRFASDFGETELLCVVTAPDGQATRVDWFAADDLRAAHQELNERWLHHGGPVAALETSRSLYIADESGVPGADRACISDDFVSRDHRRLGMGVRNADEWVASISEVVGPDRGIPVFVDALDWADHAILWLLRIDDAGPDRDASYETIVIFAVADGKLTNFDLYEVDDEPAARARFAELTGGGHRAEPSNRASRAAAQRVRQFVQHGIDPAQFTDDFRNDSHRKLSVHETIDANGIAATFSFFAERGFKVAEAETIAVRGDDHCLQRIAIRDDHGAELDMLIVESITPDDRVSRIGSFDVDQLAEAQSYLDARYFDALGFAADHPHRSLSRAAYEKDPEARFRVTHPSFQFVEHRRLSFPSGNLRDLEQNRRVADLVDHIRIPLLHGVHDHALFYEGHEIGKNGEVTAALCVVSVADGLLATLDAYDVDDYDTARSRFQEFDDANGEPSNRASRASRSALDRLLTTGDVADVFAEDYRSESRRAFAIADDRTREYDSAQYDFFRHAGAHLSMKTIAVRGENLCLTRGHVETDEGDTIDVLLVEQINDDGLFTHSTTFDGEQLVDAQIELDRRYWESLGFGEDHPMVTLGIAGYSTELDGVMAMAHPETKYNEHRRLTFAHSGDRADLAELTKSIELIDHVIHPQIHEVSDTAIFLRRDEVAANGYASSFLLVATIRDRLFGTLDIFDLDDFDAAQTRYHELTTSSPADDLSNEA